MSGELRQQITDQGSTGKYFALMLHIDDDELDPYEYRLLGHYRRVCGATNKPCFESTLTTAKITRMSDDKVRSTRDRLEALGRIIADKPSGSTVKVTVCDLMDRNVERYSAHPSRKQEGSKSSNPSEKQDGGTPKNSRGGTPVFGSQRRINEEETSKKLEPPTLSLPPKSPLPNVVIDSPPSVSENEKPQAGSEIPKIDQPVITPPSDEPPKVQGEASSTIATLQESLGEKNHILPIVNNPTNGTSPGRALEPAKLPPLAPPGYRWMCSSVSDSRMHLVSASKSFEKAYPLCKAHVRHRIPWSPQVDKPPCEQCQKIANNIPDPPDLETQLVMFAIARITGLDPRLAPGVAQTARRYRTNGYTADDLIKAQQVCMTTDWRWVDPKRGTPGRKMALDDLTRYLGTARMDTANYKYQPEMQLDAVIDRVREAGTLAAVDPDWSPAIEAGEVEIVDALPAGDYQATGDSEERGGGGGE